MHAVVSGHAASQQRLFSPSGRELEHVTLFSPRRGQQSFAMLLLFDAGLGRKHAAMTNDQMHKRRMAGHAAASRH